MAWQHLFGTGTATQVESGAEFSVNYRSNNIQTIDDIELVPTPGGARKWSAEEMAGLKEDFWIFWENERRRIDLARLIREKFFRENFRAADAISSMSDKRVSARTLQSWLIEPGKPSSRKCPAWALKALRDFLADPKNEQDLARIAKYKSDYPEGVDHLGEIMDKREVEIATNAIARDQSALEAWRKTDFNSLPIKLFELEKLVKSDLGYLCHTLLTITSALNKCKDFDAFKETVKKELVQAEVIEFQIRTVQKAIEQSLEEFSNAEGLPE
jgi:hypothetical protein